jgi:multiple sugar transport system substrate-binding protein
MRRRMITSAGAAGMALALMLTACGGEEEAAGGPVTLTMSGWSLDTTPEFKTLADSFHKANPDITIELKEYDPDNYDTQLTADLSAGNAPDVYVLKNLKNFVTYQAGEQLLDVSDVAGKLGDEVNGKAFYNVDGTTYAVPYRQDSWYLYYNKDLLTKAGVALPDGSWTWDDYAEAAEQVATKAAPAKGAYTHIWQSVVQGFALAQSNGADLESANYDFFAPYYERALKMQDAGAQVDFGTATTNKLQYQAEFGTQKAAMMLMGSWYVATLIAQQAAGKAQTFEWGIAPAPQANESTKDNPVTFGDPTGLGINAGIDAAKIDAAKKFLQFAAGEQGALELAKLGVTPAAVTDPVTDAYFSVKGTPAGELARTAFTKHDTRPENPVGEKTAALQNILLEMHTAIMSRSTPVSEAITDAEERAKTEVGS